MDNEKRQSDRSFWLPFEKRHSHLAKRHRNNNSFYMPPSFYESRNLAKLYPPPWEDWKK